MTAASARALLGVEPAASAQALRAAFRDAAKRAHPDMDGGDARRFRQVLAAYRLLQDMAASPMRFAPTVRETAAAPPLQTLSISPVVAALGGAVEVRVGNRRLKLTLPPGLREDDTVRAGDVLLSVRVAADRDGMVRGNDLWLTVAAPTQALNDGGRVVLDTPVGTQVVWITAKAAQRNLVRLPGKGLPPRGPHGQGDLFLRLEPGGQTVESPARTLLRRFTAAWAA